VAVREEPALRNSANWPRGSIETNSINVMYNVYPEYMLTKVIPAIKEMFPRQHGREVTVSIQHDNAPSHFQDDNPRWLEMCANQVNWVLEIAEQPPNSPDTNILTLDSSIPSRRSNGHRIQPSTWMG
jgi:hypothetical protein